MRKFLVFLLCLSLIGLLSVRFVEPDIPGNTPFQLAEVLPGSFDITVSTLGFLEAARSHMISSELRGDKGKIVWLTDDGARVSKGDILIKLDTSPFEEEISRLKGDMTSLEAAADAAMQMSEWEKNQAERETRTAEFNLKIARLELRKLVEADAPLQLAQFREEAEKAEQEYSRYVSYISDLEELSQKGYANPTEIALARKKASELKEKYDSANQKYMSYEKHAFPSLRETAGAKVEKAKTELGQIRKGSVFKIARAVSAYRETESRLQNVKNSLVQTMRELDKTIIHAPFSGIAIRYEAYRDGRKRKPRVGDRVLQHQPLLYLPDISSMIVKTRVREIDLHKIGVGKKCRIKVDAYPDTLSEGEVTFVGALASGRSDGTGGEKYFQITVSLKTEDPRLRPGMTARVTVASDQVRDALCVPIQAVFDENGAKYCYRLNGKSLQKVSVSIGKQNEDMVEIISGLQKGDQVSLVRPH